jgi:hypothetical protein
MVICQLSEAALSGFSCQFQLPKISGWEGWFTPAGSLYDLNTSGAAPNILSLMQPNQRG